MGQCSNCTSRKECSSMGCLMDRIKSSLSSAKDYVMGDKQMASNTRSSMSVTTKKGSIGKQIGWKGFK